VVRLWETYALLMLQAILFLWYRAVAFYLGALVFLFSMLALVRDLCFLPGFFVSLC